MTDPTPLSPAQIRKTAMRAAQLDLLQQDTYAAITEAVAAVVKIAAQLHLAFPTDPLEQRVIVTTALASYRQYLNAKDADHAR